MTSLRPNRRSKVACAFALVFAAVIAIAAGLAWAFWPEMDDESVTVAYAGGFSDGTNRASFAVTNSSKNLKEYWLGIALNHNGFWQGRLDAFPVIKRSIPARSGKLFDVPVPTNEWKIYIVSARSLTPSFPDRIRSSLALTVENHGWRRLGDWLYPREKSKTTYGPVMLGHRPVAPGQP